MSLGTAIIASRVGGLAEVLEDRETGLLVDCGDVEQWVQAMTEMAGHPDLAARLARNGCQIQGRSFNLDTMGASYWRVYSETLERHLGNG